MFRRVVVLLAVVGAMTGLVLSQSGNAFMIPTPREQPCQEERRPPPAEWLGGGADFVGRNGNYVGRNNGGLSNDADQCNGTLYNKPENKPDAYIWQKNENKNPQFALVGSNYQYNKQKNNLWLDQSQNAPAGQFNVAGQSIWDNNGGGGAPAPFAFHGGGGAPLSNDADQENQRLKQKAENKPDAYIWQKNYNINPQFTLVGNNTQNNTQQNNLWLDQSQNAPAGQFNIAGQSISRGPAPPIDPENDADQSNGELKQKAENKPDAWVHQKNVNFNPQFTLVGNNSQTNYQGNNAGVDQSQNAPAAQGNLAGQWIQQG